MTKNANVLILVIKNNVKKDGLNSNLNTYDSDDQIIDINRTIQIITKVSNDKD